VSYPNELDKVLKTGRNAGGAIYIHGGCATIGCIPVEDEPIEEIYLIGLDAQTASKRDVLVHIFPRRMDDAGMAQLEQYAADDPKLLDFWRQLRPGYLAFEETRRPPKVVVNPKAARYQVTKQPAAVAARATGPRSP